MTTLLERVAERNRVNDCTSPFPGAAGSRDRERHYVNLDGGENQCHEGHEMCSYANLHGVR